MAKNTRTADVLSLLRMPVSINKSVDELLHEYQSAKPFPYHVLDNLFPTAMLDSLLDELPPFTSEKWVHERYDTLVKSNLRSATDLGDQAYQFTSFLHSAGFLYFLTAITGIKALLPDPYLTGGGYHVVPSGGKFDVHADRNTDHHSGLERRLAMLIYLNKDWSPECGGQLELWNADGSKCEKVLDPLYNRTVIFEIGDKNFHAVRPVPAGLDFKRRSFAIYFHTVGKNLVMHNSLYAPKIFQDKEPVFRRVVRDSVPPILLRELKKFKKAK
jgi:hypothetical protein